MIEMKISDIDLMWLGHSGFLIKNNKIIYIDPYDISGGEKADIILITHPHYDHCSIADIEKIIKDGTIVVCPADCQSKIAKLDAGIELRTIDVGETIELDNGIAVGGIPAYNINKPNHPKSERWLGYLLKVNGNSIYHAGDTDLIPEMKKLTGKVQVALLPVGGSFTMNSQEAAQAVALIKPSLALPMHWGSIVGNVRDAETFKKLCVGQGIKSEILGRE